MSNIKSILKKKIKNETLWNLAVEDDESYIANGCVVHNCRSVLVPITKYDDWQEDKVTNSGKNVDKFLEENVSDKGFSIYDTNKKPLITDPGVDFDIDCPDSLTEVFNYSFNGKSFQTVTVVYKDDTKLEVKSVKNRRLDSAN